MPRPLSRLKALERKRERKNKEPVEIWCGWDEPGATWHGPNGQTCTTEELPPNATRIVIVYGDEDNAAGPG